MGTPQEVRSILREVAESRKQTDRACASWLGDMVDATVTKCPGGQCERNSDGTLPERKVLYGSIFAGCLVVAKRNHEKVLADEQMGRR